MSLKSDLLDTLETLKPYIDPTKATWELDDAARGLSSLLSEPCGLFWLEYISEHLDYGRFPLYSSNKLIQKAKLDELVEHSYRSKDQDALRMLLRFYHQLFGESGNLVDDPSIKLNILKKLESSAAIKSKTIATTYCLKCYDISKNTFKICPKCNSDDVLDIIEISFRDQVRTILSNGQYLEIYLKHCLQETGVELIGYPFDQKGKKAFTNVRYQVGGDTIEVDVHGIASPLTLLLCEAKTSAKISPNELRRIEGLYDRLVEKINMVSGRQFSVLKLFIITGEFDRNISQGAYKRKGWELIDRTSVENLKDVLREIQNEL